MLQRGYNKEQLRLKRLFDRPLLRDLGYINQEVFTALLHSGIDHGRADLANTLWPAITLELWLQDQVARGGLLL